MNNFWELVIMKQRKDMSWELHTNILSPTILWAPR